MGQRVYEIGLKTPRSQSGRVSMLSLITFSLSFQTSFQRLLRKQGGKPAAWVYPFAVAGVNITFMIMQMLDLDSCE